jgi:hypothetical protein
MTAAAPNQMTTAPTTAIVIERMNATFRLGLGMGLTGLYTM